MLKLSEVCLKTSRRELIISNKIFTNSKHGCTKNTAAEDDSIYHWSRADLVILSACSTGDGDLTAGEGPLSLARAFSYAGSNSVVMSHWRATDASTAEIVQSFLEYLAAGEQKDIALQKAKKDFLATADPLMAHPFFWAGVSLYGDTESMDRPGQGKLWLFGLIGLVLVGGIVTAVFQKRGFGAVMKVKS